MEDIVKQKAQAIRCVIFDVDGVLTDGKLYYNDAGLQTKTFHSQDGWGIKLLQKAGIEVAIITAHRSDLISHRMQALEVKHYYQGANDKLPAFLDLQATLKLDNHEFAYVGDDLPDLPIMRKVGLGIAVNNATEFVKQHANWQTNNPGGHGAVREVAEVILDAQNKLDAIHQAYLS